MTSLSLLDHWVWDRYDCTVVKADEIRRALAIAQAVEDYEYEYGVYWKEEVMRRADELLAKEGS